MKILVCGSRYYSDCKKIFDVINSLKEKYKDITIIEGGAPGADELAKKACMEIGIEVKEYKADWKRYGRAAGPKRNQLMLDSENPGLVIAFHENIESSKGTKDMVRRATGANIETIIYT